tara:strand:- start:83 stop:292 length:210 start_codon:yes stop_codon:yes gene_type:complete
MAFIKPPELLQQYLDGINEAIKMDLDKKELIELNRNRLMYSSSIEAIEASLQMCIGQKEKKKCVRKKKV